MNKLDEHLDRIQNEVGVMAVAMGLSAISTAFSIYKSYFSKASRRCSGLPDKEKTMCMFHAKVVAKNKELQALKSGASKCSKDKNPSKCKAQLASKIQKVAGELKFLNSRFKELRSR